VTVQAKLTVHLEHIVMPEGVPLNAKQVQALCDAADMPQRQAALDRARIKPPFLLPDEEHEAEEWVKPAVTMHVCGVKCGHVWDGPLVTLRGYGGERCGETATCSKCGAWAINVSMMEMP
jgi:hypothetical protein